MTSSEAALLLRDFVNTYDVESDADQLATPAELASWLAEHGLVPAGVNAGAADLSTAVVLREGLRTAMRGHHGPRPSDLPVAVEQALSSLPLRVSVSSGRPELVPVGAGVTAGLSRLAGAIVASAADGTWSRLKVCQESTCRWAFVDTSKNRSRAWCSMRVCGNRTKTRAYRARRRETAEID